MVVPGAAGIIVSNLSTANTVNGLGLDAVARKYDAAQILDINRDLLEKMGIEPALIESLLANHNYTPIDMTAMVAALDSMHGVQHREIFFARAVQAKGRAIAYVIRRSAELMADENRRHGGFVRFVSLAGFPYVVTRDGRTMLLVPIDAMSWTHDTAAGFSAVAAENKGAAPNTRGELRISGTATAMAKNEMKARGWTVLERQKP